MNVKGNDISIDIGASSASAENEIKRFTEMFKNFRSFAASRTKIKVDSSDVEKASSRVSSLTKVLSALKRIAFYRLIRTAIKAVTQAFSEGLQQAYAFSNGIMGESHRFAAAMDTMKSEAGQMKVQLGSAFIGLLTALQPIISAIISLVTQAADAIAQLFAAFTGSRYLRANQTAENLADTMKRGGGAAKEWKNQLMGFDEINRLNEPSKGGGGGGVSDNGGAFEDAPIDERILSLVQRFKDLVASIDFAPINEALGNLKESFSGLSDTIGEGLSWAWDNILAPLAHWTIETAAPAVINLLAEAFKFFKEVLKELSPAFEWVWDNILQPLAEWTGDKFTDALQTITDLFRDLTDLLSGNMSFKEFIDQLSPAEEILLAVATAIGAVSLALVIFKGIAALTKLVGGGLAGVFGLITSPIGIAILAITALIVIGIELYKHWDEISAWWKKTCDAWREAWQKAVANFKQGGEDLRQDWENIKRSVSALKDSVVQKFNGIKDSISEKMGAAWEKVKNVGQDIKDFFANLHITLPHIALPHIQVSWTDTSQSSIAKLLGITAIPNFSIAWYAKGGIVDGATLIGAGEAGKEAIIPLERNTEWISRVATEMNAQAEKNRSSDYSERMASDIRQGVFEAVTAAMSQSGSNTTVRVYLDSKEIRAGQQRLARSWGV